MSTFDVVGLPGCEDEVFFEGVFDGGLEWCFFAFFLHFLGEEPDFFVLDLVEVGALGVLGVEEELELHDGELSDAGEASAGADLVAHDLADLGEGEGDFFAGVLVASFEVDEHGLGGFGAGVACEASCGADFCFEHGEDLGGFFELAAASGAFDLVVFEELFDGFSAEGFYVFEVCFIFDEVVCSEAVVALGALCGVFPEVCYVA